MPINSLLDQGYLFMWVTKARLQDALDLIHGWGYRFINWLVWVKTCEQELTYIEGAVGKYFEHASEIALVAIKGRSEQMGAVQLHGILPDTVLRPRTGLQSEKPGEIHTIIEEFIKDSTYIEIFARDNNLRNGWISIGN